VTVNGTEARSENIVTMDRQQVKHMLCVCVCVCVCVCFRALVTPHVNRIFFWAELYCHLLPLLLTDIVPNHLTNGTIFGKKLLNIKCDYLFSLQIMSETFLILRRIQRDMYKHLHIKYPLFLLYFNTI